MENVSYNERGIPYIHGRVPKEVRKAIHAAQNEMLRRRAHDSLRLALKRAGVRCPRWARTGRFKKMFLKLYFKSQIKSFYSGEPHHVDHIIPYKGANVCGLMLPQNLHVIPAILNYAKSTLIVPEWQDKDTLAEHRIRMEKAKVTIAKKEARRREQHLKREQRGLGKE